MKIKGYSFKCEKPFFVYFKKHFCPYCGNRLNRQKVSKIIHSDSEEAKNYDFEVADITVNGNMKFTHIEFFCPVCEKYYTIKETKENDVLMEMTTLRNRELTKEQQEYRQFDKRRSVIIITIVVFLVVILICFIGAFRVVDVNPTPFLLFTGILIAYTVVAIFVGRHLARKHGQLYVAAYGNDKDVIRTGLFGEIWQEFEWNPYEGLPDGKAVFADTHNNTIELQIIRNKHEFGIVVDREALYMICDEETDTPIEKEIPLSELKNVEEFFLAVGEFIESNS